MNWLFFLDIQPIISQQHHFPEYFFEFVFSALLKTLITLLSVNVREHIRINRFITLFIIPLIKKVEWVIINSIANLFLVYCGKTQEDIIPEFRVKLRIQFQRNLKPKHFKNGFGNVVSSNLYQSTTLMSRDRSTTLDQCYLECGDSAVWGNLDLIFSVINELNIFLSLKNFTHRTALNCTTWKTSAYG